MEAKRIYNIFLRMIDSSDVQIRTSRIWIHRNLVILVWIPIRNSNLAQKALNPDLNLNPHSDCKHHWLTAMKNIFSAETFWANLQASFPGCEILLALRLSGTLENTAGKPFLWQEFPIGNPVKIKAFKVFSANLKELRKANFSRWLSERKPNNFL